jgi:hypothetical protein
MTSFRSRAACVLALSLSVAVTATAQQLPDLAAADRIKVRITPLAKGRAREEVAYVTRLDADSLHYRADGTNAATVVPWERVSVLKVSEGVRTTSLGVHVLRVGAASAFGAAMGWSSWHSCRDPENDFTLDCVLTTRRLGDATEGGAAVTAGIAAVYSLLHLKVERWRELRTPSAVRMSMRRAGGGLGVGVAIAF